MKESRTETISEEEEEEGEIKGGNGNDEVKRRWSGVECRDGVPRRTLTHATKHMHIGFVVQQAGGGSRETAIGPRTLVVDHILPLCLSVPPNAQ
jgi:hypothetical protein